MMSFIMLNVVALVQEWYSQKFHATISHTAIQAKEYQIDKRQ
jgi:hypothetical protein